MLPVGLAVAHRHTIGGAPSAVPVHRPVHGVP